MSGNKLGGLKAAQSNIDRYGKDYYKRIGSLGGSKSKGGAFTDKEFASEAGKKGGSVGKPGFKYLKTEDGYMYYLNNKTKMIVRYNLNEK